MLFGGTLFGGVPAVGTSPVAAAGATAVCTDPFVVAGATAAPTAINPFGAAAPQQPTPAYGFSGTSSKKKGKSAINPFGK